MPVIPVYKVVDPKEQSEKMEGQGGGEAQGVADPPPPPKKKRRKKDWVQALGKRGVRSKKDICRYIHTCKIAENSFYM
jgi:hypothetical protein